jgi:hypothetical protein
MSQEAVPDGVPKMLTLPEVAKALRCSVRALYSSGWGERLGDIKVGRQWLVPEEAVIEVLKGKR